MSDDPEVTPAAPETPAPDATPEATPAPEAPAIDFSPILGRLDAFDQRLDAMAPAPEPVPDAYDTALAGMYEPDEIEAARQQLGQIFDPVLQQHLAPLQKQIQDLNNELDLGDLEARYPKLAEQDTADRVKAEAAQIAQNLGAPHLAMHPKIIELAFLAGSAAERASSETPAGGTPTELESAAGASPGEPEPDYASAIAGAAKSQGSLYGW